MNHILLDIDALATGMFSTLIEKYRRKLKIH